VPQRVEPGNAPLENNVVQNAWRGPLGRCRPGNGFGRECGCRRRR
jgi:hypothetical protein